MRLPHFSFVDQNGACVAHICFEDLNRKLNACRKIGTTTNIFNCEIKSYLIKYKWQFLGRLMHLISSIFVAAGAFPTNTFNRKQLNRCFVLQNFRIATKSGSIFSVC